MEKREVIEVNTQVRFKESYKGYFDNLIGQVFTVKAFYTAKQWQGENEYDKRYKDLANIVELNEIKEAHGIGVDSLERI